MAGNRVLLLALCCLVSAVAADDSECYHGTEQGFTSGEPGPRPGSCNGTALEFGKSIVLQCNYTEDTTDKATFSWTKNGEKITTGVWEHNNSYVVVKAGRDHAGEYVCKFRGFEGHITVKERPFVIIKPADDLGVDQTSVYLTEGKKLILTCYVYGNDTGDIVYKWFVGKDSIDDAIPLTNESHPRVSVSGTNNTSVLTIDSVKDEDRAHYICRANNGVSAQAFFTIRVKDKLAALWPFLGIVGEVIILCTIIFVYEKRRGKLDFEESDTDQNTDGKTEPERSPPGQDVRQRK